MIAADLAGRTIVAEAGASIWTLPVLDEDVAAAERISKQTYMEQLLGDDYSTYVKLIAFMSSRADCADFHTAWYLSILGVHPEHQKQGIGSRLLTSTLQEADSARVMCYLETFDDNKGFYEKFGFKSTFSHFIPEINAAYTIMTRDPV